MARDIEDNRGRLGRETTGGGAAKQDTTRQDGDRGYGARDAKGTPDDKGDGVPTSVNADTPSQYSGIDGSRTDDFGQAKPG